MIVRCPECSTGFKLPKDKISTKGVKLRCSKCSHVFRIRSTDDGETEIFYADADPGPPEKATDDEDGVDEAVGSKTHFGMPNVNKGEASQEEERQPAPAEPESSADEAVDEASASRSAQPDYNPFPHAGDSIKPSKSGRFQSSSAAIEEDESGEPQDLPPEGEGIDLFDEDEAADQADVGEEEDPFAGAFDDEVPEADSEKTMQAPGPAASKDSEVEADEADSEEEAEQTSEAPAMSEVPTDDDSAFWSKQEDSGFGAAEDMVDPSFGEDGAYFDAQQGKVDQSRDAQQAPEEPATQAASQPSQSPRAPAKPPTPDEPRTAEEPSPAATPAQTSSKPSTSQAKSPSTGSADKKTSWDVEHSIEPHTVGGSGVQKAANFLLIMLVVLGLFFAVMAVMADGIIDFKRLPHTLEVAFQGKEFEPRDKWIPEQPKVKKAPIEDPVRLTGVVGNVLSDENRHMLAVRGRVKNVDDKPYEGVRVRAMLQDSNGRVVTEQEAHIGKRLNLEDILATKSVDELQQMMPTQSPPIEPGSSAPFTIVFPNIPERLRKSADVSYKVEMASGEPVGASEEAGTDDTGANK